MPDLKGKKALFIIASSNFQDDEFSQPYALLKKCGATVTVASSKGDRAMGVFGKAVVPDRLLVECSATDYDAVIFIGGPGAKEYFNNNAAHALARSAVAGGKLLAAICIAPVTLANAGVLKGKQATCFPSVAGDLVRQGAVLVQQNVVQDGKLVTAVGPEAAREFAEALARALQ